MSIEGLDRCPRCNRLLKADGRHPDDVPCTDWIDRVRRKAEHYGGANSVVFTAKEYVQLIQAAEALRELVDLHARYFDEDEASPVWERAYRARRGEL